MSLALPQPGPKYDPQNEAQARTQISQSVTQLQADTVKLKAVAIVTFANLPASPTEGQRALITDCNSTTFLAAAAGGGANIVPVFYNGTAWKIG
jgi:hypothetical protein